MEPFGIKIQQKRRPADPGHRARCCWGQPRWAPGPRSGAALTPGSYGKAKQVKKLSKGGDMSNLECSKNGRTSEFQTGSVRQERHA